MGFDKSKVDPRFADLFFEGKPDENGEPVGLTDERYDAQKAELRAEGRWPLDKRDAHNE